MANASKSSKKKLPANKADKKGPTTRKPAVKPGLNEIPILPLSNVVVFPYTLAPLVVEGEKAVDTAEKAVEGNRLVALFPLLTDTKDLKSSPEKSTDPLEIDIEIEGFSMDNQNYSKTGVSGRIVKKLKFPDGTLRILVRGLKRIEFIDVVDEKMGIVKVKEVREKKDEDIETIAMSRNAFNQFQEIIASSPAFPEELKIAVFNIDDNVRLVDLIADSINISYHEKLAILTLPTVHDRLQLITILLNRELEVIQLGSEIQSQVHNALGKSQREYFLREQLRTIKQELGEDNRNPDILLFEERMNALSLPQDVEKAVNKELERLNVMHQAGGEYQIVYTYIDWLLSIPWQVFTEDRIDVAEAKKILDKDHYDLKDVKERILEFLAVLQLKKDRKSPILCFIGPPGVGKTSLGKSIASAMERKFVRMSLGGVKDEAEIRGHRRTYIGSMPGRIIQGIKKSGSSNPVFMLDEIDKVGSDFRGDPSSALLEVLDPQQNKAFNDHYIELDYDLSSVMFIATANITDTIPPALLDRMEVIRLPGYTPNEKKQIAKRFLVPRQLKENGLKQRQLSLPMETLDHIIACYTREAGVRNLERTIGNICRKVARKIVEGTIQDDHRTVLKADQIRDYLGPQKFFGDELDTTPQKGVATGMAWTRVGGSLLPVEVTKMPGKGNLSLTGSLGDVMKESAQTAFSYIKSKFDTYKIKKDVFTKHDFHIHVPDGATPKDGPSAGITITVALLSLLTDRAVKNDVAMTGEITLRGRVTQVGGLKEKIIAALRAGIREVIVPAKNRGDLEELPKEAKQKLKFIFVENVRDAIKHLLV